MNPELKDAAWDGDVEAVRRLLAAGADPNAADEDGCLPLQYASFGTVECFDELLAAGARVEAEVLARCLNSACLYHNSAMIKRLLELGADVRLQALGETALHAAAEAGDVEAFGLIVAAGARVDCRDERGRTPVHRAALIRSIPILKLLLAAGADLHAQDDERATALDLVHRREYIAYPNESALDEDEVDTALWLREAMEATGHTAPGLRRRELNRMRVQAKDGADTFVEVDLDRGRCGCGEERCVHLDMATDVVMANGRHWRWLMLSAFHKELRRGDVAAAQHWASWLARCEGEQVPLDYMRKIWSEETADLDLAVWLHGDVTVDQAVVRFCRAPKVWESFEWWTCFHEWEECHKGVSKQPLTGLADELVVRTGDLEERRPMAQVREDALAELTGSGRLTSAQAGVCRTRYRSKRFENEDFVLAQLLLGRLPLPARESAGDAVDVDARWTDGSTLLLPPTYAYDYHSFAGKQRMREWLEKHPGSGFRFGVDTSPVDLRWSGGLVPLFWRVLAWQKGGKSAMHRLAWHELAVETEALVRFSAWCGWWPEDAVEG
jgi:hypothetical protein